MIEITAALLGLALSTSLEADGIDGNDDFRARALAERLVAITAMLPSHALILELQRVANDPDEDLQTRERALAEYAYMLREYPPDAAAWAGLEFLSSYQERSLRPHPEAGAYQGPRFNLATTARGTVNLWLRVTARERTLADLAAGRADFLQRVGPHGHPQQLAGIVEALEAADPDRLWTVREALLAPEHRDPALDPIALAVARRLADEVLLDELIGHPPSPLRFKLVYDLDRYLDGDRALQRWRQLAAGDDPQFAAAAMAALADKASPDDDLFELLAGRLAEPEIGVAAARALGRSRFAAAIPRLAVMLRADDALVAARAALALKLNGSPAALTALRASPLAEVHKWLR